MNIQRENFRMSYNTSTALWLHLHEILKYQYYLDGTEAILCGMVCIFCVTFWKGCLALECSYNPSMKLPSSCHLQSSPLSKIISFGAIEPNSYHFSSLIYPNISHIFTHYNVICFVQWREREKILLFVCTNLVENQKAALALFGFDESRYTQSHTQINNMGWYDLLVLLYWISYIKSPFPPFSCINLIRWLFILWIGGFRKGLRICS